MSRYEIRLVIEALAMAASRHESMARVQKFGRHHDEKAADMRALRATFLTKLNTEAEAA